MEFIESIDWSLFLFINQGIVNPIFDFIFPIMREFTYIVWFLFIVYFWHKKDKKSAIVLIFGIFIGAVVTYPFKFIIGRERPYDIEPVRLLTDKEFDPSFPSGHSEMSFLASVIISKFRPEFSKYVYGFSGLVALSRIYVGVHFPSDVIAGMAVGIVMGWVILYYEKKFNSSKRPPAK